ncbi:hypothetical protein G6F35_013404 [Rhizopus arrhizus]|nr:hypothetical protein G6F35_013404 [Rhizopus arrhizus]
MQRWPRRWARRRRRASSWRSACNVRSRHSGRCNSRRPATRSWISPPGHSAFDALREAQALAPRDSRVKAAAARLLPASRACFDDNLRQNRVQAAGACLQAWQTLSPTANGLPAARQRLAQRWLAIGSERLGNGDVAFAERALQQAAELGAGASSSEYQQLRQRRRDIGVPSP